MKIFDWLNQINYYKKSWDSFTENEQKTFSVFIINRWLSMDDDLIEAVNFFQKYSIGLLQPREVYKWYCDILPKQKRFNKYVKGKKSNKYPDWVINIFCKYFECSKKEAIEYLYLINKSEIKDILEKYGTDPKEIKKIKVVRSKK